MTSSDLDVAQRDAGIKGGHDERSAQHVRVGANEPGPVSDRTDPAVGGTGVESLTVVAQEDRAGGPFTDRQIAMC